MEGNAALTTFLSETRKKQRSRFPDTKFSIEELARRAGVGAATIHGYFTGKAFPDREKAEKLAKAFYPGDKNEQRIFVQRLDRMRRATERDLLTRIGQGPAYLKAAVIHYPPFCWSRRGEHANIGFLTKALPVRVRTDPAPRHECFLDATVKRLFLMANLAYREVEEGVEVDAIGDLIEGEVDVSISLFETFERARELVTYPSPLRTTLNAVCIDLPLDDADDPDPKLLRRTLKTLLDPRTIGETRERLGELERHELSEHVRRLFEPYRFVGLKNEVGYSFLLDVVRLPDSDITTANALQPDAWEEAIVTVLAGASGQPVIAIADEFSMLRLLGSLSPALQERATLLWPLATAHTASTTRSSAPLYPMGILSFSKQQQPFADYIGYCLNLLLRTDTEYISDRLKDLYERLVGDLKLTFINVPPGVLKRLRQVQGSQHEFGSGRENGKLWAEATAIRVARYALGLDGGASIEGIAQSGLVWKPVLDRAKEKIGTREDIALESKYLLSILREAPWLFDRPQPLTTADAGTADNGLEDLAGADDVDLSRMTGILALAAAPFRRIMKVSRVETTSDVWSTRSHVLAGYFATPRRCEVWRFLPTPIHVPLNALMRRDAHFKAAIWWEFAASIRDSTTPVVTRSGAAHEYLLDLGGESVQGHLEPVDSLEERDKETKELILPVRLAQLTRSGRKPAVVVGDTLTLLRVAETLKSEWEFVYPNWPQLEDGTQKADCFTTRPPRLRKQRGKGVGEALREKQGATARFLAPVFPLAVGVHSAYPELLVNMESVLNSYLRVDRQRVAALYLDAVVNLAAQVSEAMKLAGFQASDTEPAARRWARRICSVDRFALCRRMDQGNPWRPICRDVARQLEELWK